MDELLEEIEELIEMDRALILVATRLAVPLDSEIQATGSILRAKVANFIESVANLQPGPNDSDRVHVGKQMQLLMRLIEIYQ